MWGWCDGSGGLHCEGLQSYGYSGLQCSLYSAKNCSHHSVNLPQDYDKSSTPASSLARTGLDWDGNAPSHQKRIWVYDIHSEQSVTWRDVVAAGRKDNDKPQCPFPVRRDSWPMTSAAACLKSSSTLQIPVNISREFHTLSSRTSSQLMSMPSNEVTAHFYKSFGTARHWILFVLYVAFRKVPNVLAIFNI